MDIKKAELTLAILNNLGADFEDRKEAAQKRIYELEGAHKALREAASKIDLLIDGYRKAWKDGNDEFPDGMEDEQYKAIERAIRRSSAVCQSLFDVATTNKFRALGALDELLRGVENIKKKYDDQQSRLKDVLSALEDPNTSDEDKASLLNNRPSDAVLNGTGSAALDLEQRKIEAKTAKLARLQGELESLDVGEERDSVIKQIATLQKQLGITDEGSVAEEEGDPESESELEEDDSEDEGGEVANQPLFG
jgi:hypothetical protein